MKQYFLPQPLAQKAKELGFNEHCFAYYQHNNELEYAKVLHGKITGRMFVLNVSSDLRAEDCTAPLYTQITDWLEKEHNLIVMPELHLHLPDDRGATKTWFVAKVHSDGSCVKLAYTVNDIDEAIEYAFKVVEANK